MVVFRLVGGEGILDINLLSVWSQWPRWIASVVTLGGVNRHTSCCPLCAGFLGSRPIHHVSVCRGAAIHCLSSCLFSRSQPVSYSISLPLNTSLFVFLPLPSLSSCLYIFYILPLSHTPFIYLTSLREKKRP